MHERKKGTKENIMEKGKYTNVAFSSVTGVPKNSAHEPIMVRNEKSHACKYVLTAKIGDFSCAEKAPLKFSESNRRDYRSCESATGASFTSLYIKARRVGPDISTAIVNVKTHVKSLAIIQGWPRLDTS